jgi:sodium-coupled neutral amino acid transporter 11
VTCDLGVMLEITGGVSATALAFIFPAACYLTLADRQESTASSDLSDSLTMGTLRPKPTPWYGMRKLPAVVCAAFGGVVLVMSLGLTLRKTWSPEAAAKICM